MPKQFTPQEFSDHCKKIIDEIDRGELGFAKLAIAGLDAMFKRSGETATAGNHTDRDDVFIVKDADMIPQSSGFIVPDGAPCELNRCRPGLFLYNGGLGLKTEYFTDDYADVYTADSGETFLGGTALRVNRDMLTVLPVKFVARGDHA